MKPHRFASLLVLLALTASRSHATVITDTRHVIVDPATSIAVYHSSSWVFGPDGLGGLVEVTRDTRVGGSFDLVLSTYVWDLDWLGQPVENPVVQTG